MKDKLEPNMYVRLNCNYDLGIGKTIGETDEDNFIKTKFKDDFECSLPTFMIKKASHNIVDLIEVGDYVNDREVVDIFYNENDEVIGIDTRGSVDYVNSEIKSIVTKEQFESMSYKVGE